MHVVFDIAGYLYFDQNTVFPVKIRLIFCIKFLVLSHLTCEAKKKINVDSEEMHKMMSILRKTVEVIIILSVAQLVTTINFVSA